jgi:hypothetical protein
MYFKTLALATVLTMGSLQAQISSADASVPSGIGALTLEPSIAAVQSIPTDFVGFSYEYGMFQADRVPIDKLSNLIKITASLGDNVSIRVGGASLDNQKSSMPETALLGLAHFVELVAKSSPLIEGLNYRGHHPDWDIADAMRLSSALGVQVAYQIGNEPDLYKDSSEEEFARNWLSLKHEILSVVPSAQFYGPDTAYLNAFSEAFLTSNKNEIKMFTVHAYGQGSHTDSANDIYLALKSNKTAIIGYQARSAMRKSNASVSMRLTESGSISGDNTKIGNSLGGGLWCLKEMISLAEQGWSGVNFHGDAYTTTKGGYLPLVSDGHGNYTLQATFFAMWLFAHLQGDNIILHQGADIPDYISVLPVSSSDHKVHILILNVSETNPFKLHVFGLGEAAKASVTILSAPSLESSDVTIEGFPVPKDLSPAFKPQLKMALLHGQTIDVGPHEAELVTILN